MSDLEEINVPTGKVPLRTLLKGTGIIMIAPVMILFILTLYGKLAPQYSLVSGLGIFVISIIFVRPYIANLSTLTHYVEQLAQDKKATPPDLSFLNNVEALSAAVEALQNSWEIRKNQLEGYLGESKILIDSLPNILILLDDKLNVVQTNNTAQSTFRKMGPQSALDYIMKDELIGKTAQEVFDDKQGRSINFRMPQPVSREYIVRIERFPVFSPRGIALIMVMQDVTELKRVEQTFADFVANASHEIRTPLTSIVGFIETLRMSAKNDPKAQEKFLELMEEQAERMSRLVKDLLSLSKIERNLTTRPTDKVKIADIVKETVKQISWMAKEKAIEIETKIQKGLPEIIGDKDEIGQVVYNLVSNSIKYGKKGSKININIEVKENTFDEEDSLKGVSNLLAISVSDEGEGIPPEHIPRLTERFYRVDKARSRKVGGTGLGLSIVKHILDRHMGTLTIESEVGKGSVFTAWLPVPEKE